MWCGVGNEKLAGTARDNKFTEVKARIADVPRLTGPAKLLTMCCSTTLLVSLDRVLRDAVREFFNSLDRTKLMGTSARTRQTAL